MARRYTQASFHVVIPRLVLRQVKKLPKSLHDTDAYQGLLAHVKHFMSVCPLVGSLKRSKLSRRHWEELISASKAEVPGFSVHDVEDRLRLEVSYIFFRRGLYSKR